MKVTISFKTGNAAFTDNPEELDSIMKQVDVHSDGGNLRDTNGNTVGSYTVKR